MIIISRDICNVTMCILGYQHTRFYFVTDLLPGLHSQEIVKAWNINDKICSVLDFNVF